MIGVNTDRMNSEGFKSEGFLEWNITQKCVKVMKADVLTKGTQLKMLWYLQGNQRVIFKPKRYDREHVIQGKGKVEQHQVSPYDSGQPTRRKRKFVQWTVKPIKAYDGYDRHNGEIAAFHLDRILNFRRYDILRSPKFGLPLACLLFSLSLFLEHQ